MGDPLGGGQLRRRKPAPGCPPARRAPARRRCRTGDRRFLAQRGADAQLLPQPAQQPRAVDRAGLGDPQPAARFGTDLNTGVTTDVIVEGAIDRPDQSAQASDLEGGLPGPVTTAPWPPTSRPNGARCARSRRTAPSSRPWSAGTTSAGARLTWPPMTSKSRAQRPNVYLHIPGPRDRYEASTSGLAHINPFVCPSTAEPG